MALKAILDTLDELEESLHEHYKEDPATKKFVLDLTDFDAMPGVRKLKTEAGAQRLKVKDVEGKLRAYTELGDPVVVLEKLNRLPELEALAEGKLDQTKIDSIVESKVKVKLSPLERELGTLRTRNTELEGVVMNYTKAETSRKVLTAVAAAAKGLKVLDTAIEDVEMYGDRLFELNESGEVVAKEGVGITPGITPKDWLNDMQAKRPHWWGPTLGGGARGAGGSGGNIGGSNPFSHEGWNMTAQGQLITVDRKRAEQLAAQAGTTIGGGRPAPKK